MADFWEKDAVVPADTGSGQRDLGGADVPTAIAPTPSWAAKDKPVSAGSSLSDRITNVSTGAGYGAAAGLQNLVNDAKLVSAGGYTLLQQPTMADQIFADLDKGRATQAQLERAGNEASPTGAMAGQLGSVLLQAPLAEATLPERLAVEGAPLLARATEAIKRGAPLASLLGQEQAQNQTLNAVDAGATPGQALGVYSTALPINTAANLVPMGVPGNLPVRTLSGAILGGMTGLGATEAQHLATPDFAAAPTLQSALPQAGIGAILNAITGGRARTPEAFGGGDAIPEPTGPLALPAPSPEAPTAAAAPAPAPTPAAPKAPAVVDPVAAFHADPRAALGTLDHATLTQLASDAGVDVPAKADTGTVLDALAKLPAETLTRDVLPEYLDAVKAQGAAAPIAPPAEPTPSMGDLVLPSSVAVTKGGEAFTPEQGAATIAQAIAEKQAAGPGLPSPMTIVDRAGNAMDSAAFLRQANDAADAATAERQAASDRTALGLTPDIERTQGARWAAQDAANRISATELANREADRQAMADAREPSELATQGEDDTPPWWLAGQHAEAEHAQGQMQAQRDAIEPLRQEIGWDTVGGKVLRDPETGDVTGRTPWVGKAGPMGESMFWRERPTEGGRISATQAQTAMDKYQAGQPLNTREQRFIDYAQATQRGYDEDFRQSLRELEQERLEARDTDLATEREAVQRAGIDPADHDEALTLAQLVRRAYDAGAAPEQILAATFHGEPAEHARALWDLTRQLEDTHGPHREGLAEAGARDAAAADQGEGTGAQKADRAGESAAPTPAVNSPSDYEYRAPPASATRMRVGDLPRDMREDMFNNYAMFTNPEAREIPFYARRVPMGTMDIRDIKTDRIPADQLEGYGDPRQLPPIVVADGRLIDGQHRIQAAKAQGITHLRYIDATGLHDTESAGYISDLPDSAKGSAVSEPDGGLFPPATSREQLAAETARRDAARNGLNRPLVTPEKGPGELLAGVKPHQLDLVTPPTDRRPDWTPAVNKRAITAIDGLVSRYGGSTLADSIRSELVEHQSAQLIGQTIRTAEDAAALGQVYRNPAFETMRYIFTDRNGTVLGESAVSSRMPSTSMAFPTGKDPMAWIKEVAPEGSVKVWAMHNHPSSNPAASPGDISMTGWLSIKLGDTPGVPKLAGHVILDHETYGHIDSLGDYQGVKVLPEDSWTAEDATRAKRGDPTMFDQKLTSPDFAVTTGKKIYDATPENSTAVIIGDAQGKVVSIHTFPNEVLASPKGIALINQLGYRRGAVAINVVTSRTNFEANYGAWKVADQRGMLHNTIIVDPATGKAFNLRGANPQTFGRQQGAIQRRADNGRQVYEDASAYDAPLSLSRVKEVLAERGLSAERIAAMSKDELRAEQANLRRRSPPTEAEVRDERVEKATEPAGTVTGIKNATVDEERALAGKNAIEHDLKRSNPQAFATAKERLANEPSYGRDLAAELVDKPRPHTQEEAMALILDRVRISNERRAAYQDAAKAQEAGDPIQTADALLRTRNLDTQMELNDQAAKLSGHETGAALQARRVLAKEDYSMAALVNRGKVAAGRPLKDAERAALEARALDIEKREAALAAREAAQREARATPKPPREKKAAQDKFTALVDQLRTIAKADQLKKGCVI